MIQRWWFSNIWPDGGRFAGVGTLAVAFAVVVLMAGTGTALAEQPDPAPPQPRPAAPTADGSGQETPPAAPAPTTAAPPPAAPAPPAVPAAPAPSTGEQPAAAAAPSPGTDDDDTGLSAEDQALLDLATEGEVIVVTAQKREERLIDVPLAVTALSGSDLEDSFSHNLESLPRLVPTLTFRKGNTTRNSALFLRGIGTISFSIAAEPSVSTVIDGVVYARSGQAFSDLLDVERVEVLRGPQGTLFGKNASSGVIHFTTRRPKNEFEAEVTMSAFSDDEYRTRGVLSGPLAAGLRGRLTAFYGYFDGYVDNIALDEKVNGYSRQGARTLLEWEPPIPALGLNLTLIADYGRGDDDCCAEILRLGTAANSLTPVLVDVLGPAGQGPDGLTVSQNLRTRTLDESAGISLQADLDAVRHVFTSITAYREWDNTELRDGDFLSTGASHIGVFELHDTGIQEFRQFSQELRVTSPSNQRVEYQAGLYYFHLESDRSFTRDDVTCPDTTLAPDDTGVAPCLEGLSTLETPSATATFGSEFDNIAAFGQGSFRATEALRLSAGLRYTRDDVSYFHSRVNDSGFSGPGVRPGNFPGPELEMGDVFTGSTDGSGATGRAVVQYALRDTDRNLYDLNVYGSYARGYKGPAFNVFFNFSENNRLPIDTETSNAFELGAKGAFFGGKVYASATGFYQQFDNFQANNFVELDGTFITTLTNAGTVSTKGFESEVTASLSSALSINGSLAYVDAQIDQFNTNPDDPDSSDRAGEELPLSPDWKFTLGADLRLPEQRLPWHISLGTHFSWQSEQFSGLGANPDLLIDSYNMWDGNITFMSKDERVALTFLMRNILDQQFSTLITPGGPAGSFRHQVPRDAQRFTGISLKAKM